MNQLSLSPGLPFAFLYFVFPFLYFFTEVLYTHFVDNRPNSSPFVTGMLHLGHISS